MMTGLQADKTGRNFVTGLKNFMSDNNNKIRKSEAQERFDEAENEGRFAGNDADAQNAKKAAIENIRQDPQSALYDHRKELKQENNDDNTDKLARRDASQSHDYKGESQNVNDDTGRPLKETELDHPRNKAMEGMRQKEDRSES